LPLYALSEYTASMLFRAFFVSMFAALSAWSSPAQQPRPREPHQLLAALNRLQVDPAATYKIDAVSRIELRRGDGKILFEEGFLAFFLPADGRVTGLVFSGRGHVLAAPRDPVEKQQVASFLGASVIDRNFNTAYLRFTDETAAELLHEFQLAKIEPQTESTFANAWQASVLARNPAHSLRILSESFSRSPQPYFAASLGAGSQEPFEFVYDLQRPEPQMFGQGKKSVGIDYYDVWTSYSLPGTPLSPAAFRALRYQIDSTIHPDNSLSASAIVRTRVERSGERLVPFQFSGLLAIESVTLAGKPLPTFPDQGAPLEERISNGNEMLFVLLPEDPKSGDELELTFRYHGNVIRDAGNGVLFVGARERWYPHLGDSAEFSAYELTFHWPRKFRLAATGVKLDEREDGELRSGHWHTEKPASVAGFNLGEYAFASLAASGYAIDVYANRQLEQALLSRLRQPDLDILDLIPRPSGPSSAARLNLPMPEPSPADALKKLARDIDSSIRFYEGYSGPFPFHQLSVSQIPGSFGQGWPGLLYISTYSFLPAEAQQRAGLSTTGQEHFHDLVPFHEVAHQWWGNVVSWSSYRDQWIDEAIATYLSLLFADSQKIPDHKLHVWLDRFRKQLLEKNASEIAPADIGSLDLGWRLSSSRTPGGFDQLVYGKGAWVFHMLREMLRQPNSKNPDARFIDLLHALQTKYAYRALSSQDLQREVETVMTPAMAVEGQRSMEWFFADWVRGTGIPHYRVEFSTKRSEKGFVTKGKLLQSGVASSFVAPVPIYSSNAGYLGRVIAAGGETPFHFLSAREPGKLLIDPQMTLLCVIDH
jgi:hypothetical protein